MNTGLKGYPSGCGWFCRRLHDVSDVVEFVAPAIHSRITKLLTLIGVDSENFAFKTSELSLQDQNILDNWYKLKFEPFTVKIAGLFKSISSEKTAFGKLAIINDLHSQICLVELYHELIEIPFLTTQGKAEMNKLIDEFFTAFTQELAIELSKIKTIQIATNLPFKNIDPIVTQPINGFTQYKCFQYVLARVDDPKDEIPVDVINPVDEIPVDISNPVATIDETKKSGFNWWWLVAGFIGYKILK